MLLEERGGLYQDAERNPAARSNRDKIMFTVA